MEVQSLGGMVTRALQFLNGLRHQPPAVGVWHPDSFVDSLVRKVSSIALKAKVKLMRRWMCLALKIPSKSELNKIGFPSNIPCLPSFLLL